VEQKVSQTVVEPYSLTAESYVSLLYTTGRPHLIEDVLQRWHLQVDDKFEIIVVTDDVYQPKTLRSNVRYLTNKGPRNCVTGWNLAAQNAIGDIFIQVSDDLFPPENWLLNIRQAIVTLANEHNRFDIVLKLLDDRMERAAVFHPVLTRSAYDKNRFLYPPDFESMACDRWFYRYHFKCSLYAESDKQFWTHVHRLTHNVEVDDVMRIHESEERYVRGRITLQKYIDLQQL
jgi:glycosyltransferase involved in cell wall biosynthesis